MENNGPIHAPRIIAHTETNFGDLNSSVSASRFPKHYTVMTINISNNTDGPIRLLKAGWDLTGTSLSDFEIDKNEEQTLDFLTSGISPVMDCISKKGTSPRSCNSSLTLPKTD